MKSIAKILLAGAVVACAVALAAAPSEAAKKKAMKASCSQLASCSTNCKGKSCELRTCGPDGKWYLPVLSRVCHVPDCPSKC